MNMCVPMFQKLRCVACGVDVHAAACGEHGGAQILPLQSTKFCYSSRAGAVLPFQFKFPVSQPGINLTKERERVSSMDESSLLAIQIMISPSKTQDLFDDSLIALVLKIVKKKSD